MSLHVACKLDFFIYLMAAPVSLPSAGSAEATLDAKEFTRVAYADDGN